METEAFGFYHGATWMDLEGRMYVVPGFHDEWLKANPDLAGDARSVADMVVGKRWVSVVVYSKGYVEICINDARDQEVVALVHSFLERNKARWESALVMPMVEEGFIQVSKNELGDMAAFSRTLALGVKDPA